MITPNESVTWVPRQTPTDMPTARPVLLVVGDAKGRVPPGKGRVATFSGSLIVGRREATQAEPGASTLILSDRMISSQHLAITAGSGESSF